MKRITYILAITGVLLSSCNDFLDIKPYGKTVPKTREEFKALIDNTLEGIDKGNTGTEYVMGSISTASEMEECADNMETNIQTTDYLTNYVGDILSNRQSVYQNLYEVIRTANITLDGYKPATYERQDSDIIGTCYALRGVCYYQLLKQFCVPAMTADNALGVPLVTEFNLEATPSRSTWDATFRQAETDMKTAMSYHIADKMYRFNDDVMCGYLARLYHWSGHWQEAYDYAMKVVERHPLLDSTEYRKMQDATYGLVGNRIAMGSLLFNSNLSPSSRFETLKGRPLSKRFLDLFNEGDRDVRYASIVAKKRRNNKMPRATMRSAEMYLIAMECQAHLGNETEAQDMLMTLRKLRTPTFPYIRLASIPKTEYIQTDATGKPLTKLMYNILRERRKEMYMENGDRFWELKRNGCPEFWVAVKGKKYWTRSYMYTFPIPVNDIYVNPSLQQNEGYNDVE